MDLNQLANARVYRVDFGYQGGPIDHAAASLVAGDRVSACVEHARILRRGIERAEALSELLREMGDRIEVEERSTGLMVVGMPQLLNPYTEGDGALLQATTHIPVAQTERALGLVKTFGHDAPKKGDIPAFLGGSVSRESMSYAFSLLEVGHVLMNARSFAGARKLVEMQTECLRPLLKRGFMGELWGANVMCSRDLPEKRVYFVSQRIGERPGRWKDRSRFGSEIVRMDLL